MSEITLPPMPDPLKFSMLLTSIKAEGLDAYTEEQLQAYARAAVLADRAEREKDAERYRWLADPKNYPYDGWWADNVDTAANKAQLDAAIDAAMQEGK
jgi:hypothetical protein